MEGGNYIAESLHGESQLKSTRGSRNAPRILDISYHPISVRSPVPQNSAGEPLLEVVPNMCNDSQGCALQCKDSIEDVRFSWVFPGLYLTITTQKALCKWNVPTESIRASGNAEPASLA